MNKTKAKMYVEERDRALSELDMGWARRMIPLASDDHTRLVAMHKARYEATGISPGLRTESGDWLRKRGYKRMYGLDILPNGELPD